MKAESTLAAKHLLPACPAQTRAWGAGRRSRRPDKGEPSSESRSIPGGRSRPVPPRHQARTGTWWGRLGPLLAVGGQRKTRCHGKKAPSGPLPWGWRCSPAHAGSRRATQTQVLLGSLGGGSFRCRGAAEVCSPPSLLCSHPRGGSWRIKKKGLSSGAVLLKDVEPNPGGGSVSRTSPSSHSVSAPKKATGEIGPRSPVSPLVPASTSRAQRPQTLWYANPLSGP